MEKHVLSKSTFVRGVQCLKSLYLNKNRGFLRDWLSPEQQAKFKRGTKVGQFATQLFPGGVDVNQGGPAAYRKALELTQFHIKNRTQVIYEATFQHDGVLVMIDILVKKGEEWEAFEVKSSLKISETFMIDASLQYYVINNCIPLYSFYLVHINPNYIRDKELEINELFTKVNVTEEIILKQDFIKSKIIEEKQTLERIHSPDIRIGTHCNIPYPCDFQGHCWKGISKDSIFSLSEFPPNMLFDLYFKGIELSEDIPEEMIITEKQRIQRYSHSKKVEYIDTEALQSFLPKSSDITVLKILNCKPPIPLVKGTSPYQSLPIGFGCIKYDENGSIVFEKIFVENKLSFPSNQFFAEIAEAIQESKEIAIFNEDDMIFSLQNSFHSSHIAPFIGKMIDLSLPFKNFIYYSHLTQGQFNLSSLTKSLLLLPASTQKTVSNDIIAGHLFLDSQNGKDNSSVLEQYIKESTMMIFSILEFLRSKSKQNIC